MNYIKHLTGFFDRIIQDRSLNPTHISLYIALFQSWNVNRFVNPISISRDEVMRICKISSKATYHKCMRDLNEKGYVKYEPSYNPYKGSILFLYDFSDYLKPVQKRASSTEKILSKKEQVLNKQETSSESSTGTSTEQAMVSYINNTNITNKSNISNISNVENLGEQSQIFQNEDEFLKNNDIEEKEKSSAKKEKEMPEQLLFENQKSFSPAFADYNAKQTENSRQKSSAKKEKSNIVAEDNRQTSSTFADANKNQIETSQPKEFIVTSSVSSRARHPERSRGTRDEKPTIEEVKSYFLEQTFPEREANKFFNYFSSVGWLVGGKTPMVDWKAASNNWMLNAPSFISYEKTPDRAKHLNTGIDKDYAEPF